MKKKRFNFHNRHSMSCLKQIYRVMKLTTFILFVLFFQVSAGVFSQNNGKFSIRAEQKTIHNILKEIEDQTNYTFMYNRNNIDVDRKTDINMEVKDIEKVLDALFKGTNVKYRSFNHNYVLYTDEELPSVQSPQPVSLSGKVTDKSGAPLPGVTVTIMGTTLGTITNTNGEYQLSNVEPDASLVFSFVGMKTMEISVSGKRIVDVEMEEETIGIEEVVAIGYGTQKKSNITGAISVISDENLKSRPSSTVTQILLGQSPGIDFGIGVAGYQPGAQMTLKIRGLGSISGASPFIVVDGIPGSLDNLNPEDIESISVLKDASASAVYGAHAAHGVILVTTKSGSRNKEITATYNGSISVNFPMVLPGTLDSYTYARVHNEAAQNSGARYYSNEVVDRIVAYQNKDWDYLKQFVPADATHFETVAAKDGNWAIKWDAHANNDWLDIFFGKAVNNKHNFSLEGGSEKISYYFSAGSIKENSYLNYADDSFGRYNLSGKVKMSVTDWWDFTVETRMTKGIKKRPNFNSTSSVTYLDFFRTIFEAAPTNPLYDAYGNTLARLGNFPNIIGLMRDGGQYRNEYTENFSGFFSTMRPVKGWEINADFAYKSFDSFVSNTVKTLSYPKANGTYGVISPRNYIRNQHASDYYWTSNIYTSYDLNLKSGHHVRAMTGMQFEYDKGRNLYAGNSNMILQDVPSLATAVGEPEIGESLTHTATQGFFGRLNYDFREKYLIESSFRYDGTSRFSEGNRWGFFPSFSLGWFPSKEKFWESLSPYVNTLKIRGSWGSLGNQKTAAYQDLQLIPIVTGSLNWVFEQGGTRPKGYTNTPGLVSKDLTWETVTTKNIGMDAGFLKQRLQLGVDLFEKTTEDMIGPVEAVPGVLGVGRPSSNNASLRTRGWEVELGWKDNPFKDFSYHVNLNLYDNTTIITKYHNPTRLLSQWYEGKESGEIWGYVSNGLFGSQEEIDNHPSQAEMYNTWRPGDVKYEDISKDGKVSRNSSTLDDPGDRKIIGNASDHYQFGISLGANYKGFDLSMLWRGVAKKDIATHFTGYGSQAYFGFLSQTWSSIFDYHLDYYRDTPGDQYTGLYEGDANINTDAWYPRPYLSSNENPKNRHVSTRYLLNGAYIRLQNVQIGYNFPDKVISKIGVSRLRIYVSGDNLLTFSHLPKGIDPVADEGEIEGARYLGNTYGAGRLIAFGLMISTK